MSNGSDPRTPFLDLTKPIVNDEDGEDLWGEKLNTNFDILDENAETLDGAITAIQTDMLPEAPNDGQKYARNGQTKVWEVAAVLPINWTDITGQPATYPPTLPIPISGVTNLATTLGDLDTRITTATNTNTTQDSRLTAVEAKNVTQDNRLTAVESKNTAQDTAISGKEPTIAAGTTAQYWRGDKSWQTLNKAAVGLGNVDNTADAAKPVSTAQQAALDLKANLASPAFTGNPTAPTPSVGDNDTSIATTAFVTAAVVAAGGAAPSNANPAMDGTAAPGTSPLYARGDHVHPSDTSRVAKAGDTMTGTLTLALPWPNLTLNKPAGGTGAYVQGQTNGKARWVQYLGDNSAESGSNAGSDYTLLRYDDAGNAINVAFGIARQTGVVTLTASMNLNAVGWPGININVLDATGAGLIYSRSSKPRWNVQMDNAVESGSNAGSNYNIYRCDDAGNPVSSALMIYRSTGDAYWSGNVNVQKANPAIGLLKSASGQDMGIFSYTAGKNRWGITLGNSSAETGGNAGSDFGIIRYNDAGAYLGTPLQINRATGDATFASSVYAAQNFGSTSTNVVLAGSGASGTIYLRPRGVNDGVGNTVIYNDGSMNVYGSVTAGSQYAITNMSASFASDASYTNLTVNPNCYLSYAKATGQLSWVVNGATQAYFQYNSGTSHFIITGNGYKPGGGPWADSSDIRIKNVLAEYDTGLDAIMALRPVRYTFKGNDTSENDIPGHQQAAAAGTEFIGLIAQNVETVMPEMVTKRRAKIDGELVDDMRDLDTGPLIYALINSIKQLDARVRELEAR